MSDTTNSPDPLSALRRKQFYLVEMAMNTPAEDPLAVLGPTWRNTWPG